MVSVLYLIFNDILTVLGIKTRYVNNVARVYKAKGQHLFFNPQKNSDYENIFPFKKQGPTRQQTSNGHMNVTSFSVFNTEVNSKYWSQ